MSAQLSEREREVLGALVEELAVVVGTLLDTDASAAMCEEAVQVDWRVSLAVSGAIETTLVLGFEHAAATALARRMLGLVEVPESEAVAAALREVTGQAASALAQNSVAAGLSVAVGGRPGRSAGRLEDPPAAWVITTGDGLELRVAGWAAAETAANSVHIPAAPARVVDDAVPIGLAAAARPNLDVILDVELPLAVRLGQTEMTLHALSRLGPGSVIDLDRSIDDPVDVLINGRMIARGEVVVVSGNYGVRITEVLSADERIRMMGC